MEREKSSENYLLDARAKTYPDHSCRTVAQGRHNLPQEDIRRRYARSLANLPAAIELADRATILDNSTVAGHQLVLIVENGRVVEQVRELPEWVKALLSQEIIGEN